jgi:hypothetical protein
MDVACCSPMLTWAEVILNNVSDSEESSDEDVSVVLTIIAKRKAKSKPIRIEQYVERVVRNYTATQFQQHFRITIDAYEILVNTIGEKLRRQEAIGRNTIDVENQLLAVIWLLVTPVS